MKTYARVARPEHSFARPSRRPAAERSGTVIIVVLALLGLLVIISFFALTFTGSAHQSATYFANSPAATSSFVVSGAPAAGNADPYFDDVLRQLIIGPSASEKQSVLWGGNKSLVPAMFGRDLAPYNGLGVNLIWNTTSNLPIVDQNFDNIPDDGTGTPAQLDNRAFMFLNLSPAAAAPWQAGTAYVTGSFVTPASSGTGFMYIATNAGVSGTSQPIWPTSAGLTVTDGPLTWKAVTSLDLNNFPATGISYPDPDANITYPDINNAYLASDTLVPNGTANFPVRVLTPSFHRPMLLRNLVPSVQWYTNPITAPYVLYPHAAHVAIDNSGNITNVPRFVTGSTPDNSNIGTPLIPFPIPGDPANATLNPPWQGGPAVQEGVWTAWSAGTAYVQSAQVVPIPPNGFIYSATTAGTSGGTTPVWPTSGPVTDGSVVWTPIGPTTLGYDVDTDNDGIPDARYMDFGLPLMTTPDGSQQFVPLIAVKMIDADSLFNLNVHGNRAGLAQLPVTSNFAGGTGPPATFLSLSDHGVSASEVNTEWALNARPAAASPGPGDFGGSPTALAAALQQYTLLFRPGGSGSIPSNNFDLNAGPLSFELANMDWWNLLNGRPQLASGSSGPVVSGSSFVGRWGENLTRLDPNVNSIITNPTTVLSAGISAATDAFPLPGTSQKDDNFNALEGGTYLDEQNIYHSAFVQPIDFFSSGTWVTTGLQGKQRMLYPNATPGTVAGAEQFPQYSQFFVAPTVSWAGYFITPPVTTIPTWNGTSGYTRLALTPFTGPLVVGGAQVLVDEPDETVTEPSAAAQQPDDNIFDPSENVIQLSGSDFSALGNPGRTASLMPFNFASNQRAALIRQHFTSTSWDLKSFGKEFLGPYDGVTNEPRRLWEFTDTSGTGVGPFRFPPNFVGTNGTLVPPTILSTTPDDATTTTSATPPGGSGGSNTTSVPFVYPLRLAVANLIQVLANPSQTNITSQIVLPQRPISLNGLTELYQSGTDSSGNPVYTFRFRPLTPHPSSAVATFANTPITPFPTQTAASSPTPPVAPTTAGNSMTFPSVPWIAEPEQLGTLAGAPTQTFMQQQEWLARYDRQRLARDIYTLLYLTGGGADTSGSAINYATAANQPIGSPAARPVYTDDQLQEMAQLAVNLVDALDTDGNITVFEYDKDLSDGWNLDDNAYDNGANDPITASHPNDRGVVYGQERQQLTLNEGMIAFSQQCQNSMGMAVQHPDVQWDTTKQWNFLSLELENVGPTAVSFQNQSWQIAIKQSPAPTSLATSAPTLSTYYGNNTAYPSSGASGEMRLIFTSSQPNVPAGGGNGGTNPPPRLTLGCFVGSSDGKTYNMANTNPAASPTAPYASYMVLDPNDKDAIYQTTAYDNNARNAGTNLLGFPIAPRAAFVSPTATPIPASADNDLFDLDLALPDTASALKHYADNYVIVPPGASTTPPTGILPAIGDGQTVLAPNATLGAGTQLLQFQDPTNLITLTTTINLRVELRRRADPNRLPPAVAANGDATTEASNLLQGLDNPWVVVDYMDIPVSKLVLKYNGNDPEKAVQIQAQLGDLGDPGPVSTERSQPLYHDFTLNPVNTSSAAPYPRNGGKTTLLAPLWQGNSLGQDNDAAGFNPGTQPIPPPTPPTTPPTTVTPVQIAPHPLYQPIYDRDFTSLGELFNIPLYGPYGPQSPTTLNTVSSSGSSMSLSSGLTHLMASRVTEAGVPYGTGFTPEMLTGVDYVPSDALTVPKTHYPGYGTAGFRLQHPEGGDQTVPSPTTDPTENRWFRLLGLVEVPTRSHRGINNEPAGIAPYQIAAGSINGSLGFYRTPGKININTLRHPEIVAGLVGEPDIFNMAFTPATFPAGQNLPVGLQVPYLLQDAARATTDPDNVAVAPPQNPMIAGGISRDWWEQFIATRDGVDPLPLANGGTGLSIPGLPRSVPGTTPALAGYPANFPLGSHPFRGMGFSAYGGVNITNGYNGPLESDILRSLPGDVVTTGAGTFDLRRRLFELGTSLEHTGASLTSGSPTPPLDYATKQRLLSRLIGNTTTRSNVFFVWIQVDFFQAKDVGPSLSPPDTGVVRIGAKLNTSPGYRGFFVIDRSQALSLVTPQSLPTTSTSQPFVFSFNQSFNYQPLILYRQRIQ